MELLTIMILFGMIFYFLDALRRDLEEIRDRQDQQNKNVIELLEHIAGAAEAVKEGRRKA